MTKGEKLSSLVCVEISSLVVISLLGVFLWLEILLFAFRGVVVSYLLLVCETNYPMIHIYAYDV